MARVVAFRNQLAQQIGHPEMPMPTYGSKPAVKAPSITDGQHIERLADEIAASGIDISALLGALAKRMSASTVSG